MTIDHDQLRDSDRARLALMVISWQIQQADGLAIAMSAREKKHGKGKYSEGLGADRWESLLERVADDLVALMESSADVFNGCDAVEWPDELLNPIFRCLCLNDSRKPEGFDLGWGDLPEPGEEVGLGVDCTEDDQ